MDDSISLFCLIYGEPFAQAFKIKIGRGSNVSNLKKHIIYENANDLRGIDAKQLDLWNVEIPITDDETPQTPDLSEARLVPTKKVGTLFSAEPRKDHVHIIVKVPDLSDERERKRRRVEGLYEELWNEVWRDGKPPFKVEAVKRGDEPIKVDVPDRVWTFQSVRATSTADRLLVRAEYEFALRDIIDCRKQQEAGQYPKESLTDVDGRKTSELHEVGSTNYTNPFSGWNERGGVGFLGRSVLGHPGIGKSMLLYYILLLRLQAKLPTILITRMDKGFLFWSGGVNSIIPDVGDIADDIRGLESATWCLVDSNPQMKSVPYGIWNLDICLVQAACPRLKYIKWLNKAIFGGDRYYMKPFSLEELIIGRAQQAFFGVSTEKELQQSFEKFPPSARRAYGIEFKKEEKDVLANLARLSLDGIQSVIADDAHWHIDHGLPHYTHRVFAIRPGDVRRRCIVTISPYLLSQLLRKLEESFDDAAAALYGEFVRWPSTRSVAGLILHARLHRILLNTSYWPIKALERQPETATIFWELGDDPATHTLVLEKEGVAMLNGIRSKDMAQRSNLEVGGLCTENFTCKKIDRSTPKYFQLESEEESTFDAMVFPSTSSAIVFEATVGETHSAKPGGFEFLRTLGIEDVRYVAVVPEDSAFRVSIPSGYADMVKAAFLLEVGRSDIPARITAPIFG